MGDRHFVAASRDTYLPDGGAGTSFGSLWWRAGRYLQLLIETADEPLRIEELALWETRYPLEMESRFQSDDARLARDAAYRCVGCRCAPTRPTWTARTTSR